MAGAVLALLLALPLEFAIDRDMGLDGFAIPITACILLGLMLAFVRAREDVPHLEILTFSVLALFFLAQLIEALYAPVADVRVINERVSEFGFWFPTFYASVMFMLGVDKGWRIAVGHFVVSLAVGLPYLVGQLGGDLRLVYSLSQLYISSGVLIITVVLFSRYTERAVSAKAELEHLANTDFVTSIGNRRRMERLLEQEVTRAQRYGRTVSLLLLDLDHFKQVNDRYGHPAGDEVLREVSALLLAESRTADHIGRWGGEEFVLILPDSAWEAALKVAERVVKRIDAHHFHRVGHITGSVGGSCLEFGDTAARLVKRADEALYQAKEAGRNRVVIDAAPVPARVGESRPE